MLVLCMSFFATHMVVFAATEYVDGYLRYTVAEGSVTITGYNGRESEVTVPSSIAGVPVNTIASGAFQDSAVVTKVNLPDTIMAVEEGAFGSGQTVIYSSNVNDSDVNRPSQDTTEQPEVVPDQGNTSQSPSQGSSGDTSQSPSQGSSGGTSQSPSQGTSGGTTQSPSQGTNSGTSQKNDNTVTEEFVTMPDDSTTGKTTQNSNGSGKQTSSSKQESITNTSQMENVELEFGIEEEEAFFGDETEELMVSDAAEIDDEPTESSTQTTGIQTTETKPSNNNSLLIIITIVVVLVAAGIGGFIYIKKDDK